MAQMTKWAFDNNLLNHQTAPQALAEVFFKEMTTRYPQTRPNKHTGLREIEKDIRRTLRVLTYGKNLGF